MSEITLAKPEAQSSGLAATLKHARYVIGENPVTGFAFGLFKPGTPRATFRAAPSPSVLH